MKRKLKLYLETTIFNFVFAEDSLEKRDDTLKLFAEIKQGLYEVFTSKYVLDELERAGEPKRSKMKALIKDYGVEILPTLPSIVELSEKYIEMGMIPAKYPDDALHIAAASVWNMDVIASWNFKHIVKIKTVMMTEAINNMCGYSRVMIHSPKEIIEYDGR